MSVRDFRGVAVKVGSGVLVVLAGWWGYRQWDSGDVPPRETPAVQEDFDESPDLTPNLVPPDYAGIGTPENPIRIECNRSSELPWIRLKDLGHDEATRVHWVLVNRSAEPLPFARLTTDCSCVDASPTSGTVPANGELRGHFDYRQETMGFTRRQVIFEAGGSHKVELVSLKARDQYIDPTQVNITDEDFSITWHALYANDATVIKYRLSSEIKVDPAILRLKERETLPPVSRTVGGTVRQVGYGVERERMTFSINPDAPVGRSQTHVTFSAIDARNGASHTYTVPVYVTVRRGVNLHPTAVALGVNEVGETRFPLVRTVEITGIDPSRDSTFSVEPSDGPVRVRVATLRADGLTLEVVVSKDVLTSVPLRATVTGTAYPKGRDGVIRFRIPVSGVFRQN